MELVVFAYRREDGAAFVAGSATNHRGTALARAVAALELRQFCGTAELSPAFAGARSILLAGRPLAFETHVRLGSAWLDDLWLDLGLA